MYRNMSASIGSEPYIGRTIRIVSSRCTHEAILGREKTGLKSSSPIRPGQAFASAHMLLQSSSQGKLSSLARVHIRGPILVSAGLCPKICRSSASNPTHATNQRPQTPALCCTFPLGSTPDAPTSSLGTPMTFLYHLQRHLQFELLGAKSLIRLPCRPLARCRQPPWACHNARWRDEIL